MKKNIFTREVKLGLVAIVTIFVLYFGLNFLKGKNIFSSTDYYYGTYQNIGGLVESAPVYIKGYKVGQVEKIQYDFLKSTPFTICVSIDDKLQLPLGTQMVLSDDGLLGGKAVQLVYPDVICTEFQQAHDTLQSICANGLLDGLDGIVPQISSTIVHLDSLMFAINTLVTNGKLDNTLTSIDQTTADLASSSAELKSMLKNDVPGILNKAETLLTDIGVVGNNLKQIDFAATFNKIDTTLNNLELMTNKFNSTENTLGLLVNDKQLYINLSNTVSSADKLLIDLQQHPKRYVHFSLFGNKKPE